MYKIGVMGGRETVMGFKALGLDVFPVDSADEARHTLRRITSGAISILNIDSYRIHRLINLNHIR